MYGLWPVPPFWVHQLTELNWAELHHCLKMSCTLQPWEWDSSLWQLWILMPKLNWWSRSQKSTESSKIQAQKDTGQIMTQHVPILNASTSTDYWIYWRCWIVNSESHTHQNKQQLHSVRQGTVLQHRVTDTRHAMQLQMRYWRSVLHLRHGSCRCPPCWLHMRKQHANLYSHTAGSGHTVAAGQPAQIAHGQAPWDAKGDHVQTIVNLSVLSNGNWGRQLDLSHWRRDPMVDTCSTPEHNTCAGSCPLLHHKFQFQVHQFMAWWAHVHGPASFAVKEGRCLMRGKEISCLYRSCNIPNNIWL